MEKFEFIAKDVFTIFGRGIVFTGDFVDGKIYKGQVVKFHGMDLLRSATVAGIEYKGIFVDGAEAGQDIGLLLNQFQPKDLNKLFLYEWSEDRAEQIWGTLDRWKKNFPIHITLSSN